MEYNRSAANVIPYPKEVTPGTKSIRILPQIDCKEELFQKQKETFVRYMAKTHQVDLLNGEEGISVVRDDTLRPDQYQLRTENGRVVIRAAAAQGLGYAFATLLQLFSSENGLQIQELSINDWPDKDFRCLMVDVARQFHPIGTLYQDVDLCYLYKIRYLQLHLTDDQNCTLPCEEIGESGASRRHYTENQLRELGEYAADRGVLIIPEVEFPGHAGFLIQHTNGAYGRNPHQYTVCAGDEAVFQHIFAQIRLVSNLFPSSPYIHIGGDEVDPSEWENCPLCRAYAQKQGFRNSQELYCAFVGKIASFVLSLGKRPIVWEGFPKEGASFIPKETIVGAFEIYYNMPGDLLDMGFDIINASWKPFYITPSLSWPYVDIHSSHICQFRNWVPVSSGYGIGISLPSADRILGAQLSSWENNHTDEFPIIAANLAALSERVWTIDDHYGTLDFERRRHKLRPLIGRFLE